MKQYKPSIHYNPDRWRTYAHHGDETSFNDLAYRRACNRRNYLVLTGRMGGLTLRYLAGWLGITVAYARLMEFRAVRRDRWLRERWPWRRPEREIQMCQELTPHLRDQWIETDWTEAC